jgi:hypothetical protein
MSRTLEREGGQRRITELMQVDGFADGAWHTSKAA